MKIIKIAKCVVKCCPQSGHITIKDYQYFMTKFVAILATDNTYFYKCCLIIVKFCEQSEYVKF